MADTWRRIPDSLIRKAFQEILEVLKGNQSITELPKNLWAKISKIEADTYQAAQLAYDALQAAANAQSTADGKIVSYYQPEAPADASEGDIWFDTDDDNRVYRYTNGSWVEARDEGIPLAIQLAQNAQATADGKIVTYYQDDQPTDGSEGDLWIDTNDGNRLYRYTGGSWVEVQDQQIQQALAAAADAQATADGKIVSFFQPDEPTGQAVGDLWFDTDDGNHVYRWDGSQWIDAKDTQIGEAIQLAQNAQATADGKIVTYYQDEQPSNASEGDLWFDTDNANKLYRMSGGNWTEVRDAKIYEALQKAQDAQTTADGKIVSFYQPDEPTGQALGDLWFDTDDGNHAYRWDGSQWVDIKDSDIARAINDAAMAQATADGKIVTYYQNEEPTGQTIGDLWFDTDDDNKAYRWNGSQWAEIRDAKIYEALQKAQNAQATADGKIVSFYQPDEPAGQAVGDLWFDTDDGNHAYRWDGSQWVDAKDSGIAQAINDAALAQATADSKIVTYYQPDPPTGQTVGDLWVDTDDLNHLYRWDGSAWQSIRDGLIEEVGYSKEKLQQDLLTGVSLVFKDISEFDETVPSAIAIGDITLNSDGTVAYGSRGVAITKNGLAGYDDSYNGDGDLPSFEIDTGGNATFRGTVSGAEVQGIHGSFASLEAGDISTDGILLSSTDIEYYRGGTPFKAVKNVQAGVANNGDTVNLTGYYDRAPKVIVSPFNLMTYKANNTDADQIMILKAENLSGSTTSGEWSFIAKAELKITNKQEKVEGDSVEDNGSETHPEDNTSMWLNSNWQDITDGNLDYVDIESSFSFTDTDYSQMTIRFYLVLVMQYSGSADEWHYQYIGEYQVSDWGTTDASFTQTIYLDDSRDYTAFRYGFKVEFVSYDGDSTDDNNVTICGDHFDFHWTEQNHRVSACNYSTDFTFHYSGETVLSPEGQLNWIAIG